MSLPLATLKPGGAAALDTLLEQTVAKGDLPGVFFSATNARETIYQNQDGELVSGDPSKGTVKEDTTLEIYSMTKLITCIAVMQLVEQGLVSLDSTEDIEKHLPEIGKLPLITGNDGDTPVLVKTKNKVTLRMLMTHTAGFCYPIIEPILAKWVEQNGRIPDLDKKASLDNPFCHPLIFEPGTSYTYSYGMDWVGCLVTRLTGLNLEEAFKRNVFSRVQGGMPDTSFYPRQDIKDRKMPVHIRDGDGKLVPIGFGVGRPETVSGISDFLAGGTGLFGTVRDYNALLRALLQCDPRNQTPPARPLVSKTTYAEMFKGCLPPLGAGSDARKKFPEVVQGEHFLDPAATAENVDHSIAFALNLEDSKVGRKKGSGTWFSFTKIGYWIDPTVGLAGVCGTQMLLQPIICAPNPDAWSRTYQDFERTLYQSLA